jgi:hypothetical protein
MNAARQRIFVFSLMVDFYNLLILDDSHTRFMAVG